MSNSYQLTFILSVKALLGKHRSFACKLLFSSGIQTPLFSFYIFTFTFLVLLVVRYSWRNSSSDFLPLQAGPWQKKHKRISLKLLTVFYRGHIFVFFLQAPACPVSPVRLCPAPRFWAAFVVNSTTNQLQIIRPEVLNIRKQTLFSIIKPRKSRADPRAF